MKTVCQLSWKRPPLFVAPLSADDGITEIIT